MGPTYIACESVFRDTGRFIPFFVYSVLLLEIKFDLIYCNRYIRMLFLLLVSSALVSVFCIQYWILLILSVLTEIALIIYAAVFPPTVGLNINHNTQHIKYNINLPLFVVEMHLYC